MFYMNLLSSTFTCTMLFQQNVIVLVSEFSSFTSNEKLYRQHFSGTPDGVITGFAFNKPFAKTE